MEKFFSLNQPYELVKPSKYLGQLYSCWADLAFTLPVSFSLTWPRWVQLQWWTPAVLPGAQAPSRIGHGQLRGGGERLRHHARDWEWQEHHPHQGMAALAAVALVLGHDQSWSLQWNLQNPVPFQGGFHLTQPSVLLSLFFSHWKFSCCDKCAAEVSALIWKIKRYWELLRK